MRAAALEALANLGWQSVDIVHQAFRAIERRNLRAALRHNAATGLLIGTIQDRDLPSRFRCEIALALCKRGERSGYNVLLSEKDNHDWSLRSFVESALEQLKSVSIETKLVALQHHDPRVRKNAVLELAKTQEPRVNIALINALRDSSPEVVREVAEVWTKHRDSNVVEPLISVLGNKS